MRRQKILYHLIFLRIFVRKPSSKTLIQYEVIILLFFKEQVKGFSDIDREEKCLFF